jgi:hypothetical protein
MQRYRVRTAAGKSDYRHHGIPPERESACRVWIPGKGRAVAFAGSKEAGGFANAAHFADRGEVVGYVEEGLVGEDDVEGSVGKGGR